MLLPALALSPSTAALHSIRTPHPTLISFVLLPSSLSHPVLALLSLSSTPSQIPGLGGQCLPVLSFHAIDLQSRELKPLSFGPARQAPRIEEVDNSSSASVASGRERKKSSNGPRPSGLEGEPSSSRNIPGAFDSQEADYSASLAQQSATISRRTAEKAPASNGLTRSVSQERLREEKLASSPLTRAHVPLPFEDACGAHLLLALPSAVNNGGGGLVIFGERSIMLVPGPNRARRTSSTPSNVKGTDVIGAGSPEKRRKSSMGASALSTSPTSPINPQSSLSSLATSPLSSRQNENGKRRRSSVKGSGACTSLEATRSTIGNNIQVLKMQSPMQVISAVVVNEPEGSGEKGSPADGLSPLSEDGRSSLDILFATHSGLLHLLSIDMDGESRTPIGMNVVVLGSTSAPGGLNGLQYLGDSLVHVSSASGDSVLVKIESESQLKAESALSSSGTVSSSPTYLTTVSRIPNLAPIMDFFVDDGAGGDPTSTSSAQARILTCSGSGPTGSIRSVRNGVSTSELFSVSLDSFDSSFSVEKIWHVEDSDAVSKFLVLGDVGGTVQWLVLKDGGFEDASITVPQLNSVDKGGVLTLQSLSGGCFVQISKSSIVAVNPTSAAPILDQWLASSLQSEITCASANKVGQILVSLRGGKVAYLEVSSGSIHLQQTKTFSHEVASVDISSLDTDAFVPNSISAVGFWGLNKVKILSVPALEDVTPSLISSENPLDSLPVSILLHTFAQVDSQAKSISTSSPHLLVGLGNGMLHSYSLSLPTKDSFSRAIGVNERKVVSIGNTSVILEKFQTDEGKRSIWCNSDRSAVLFSESSSGGDRLTYSSTKFRDTKSIASLSTGRGSQAILALSVAGKIQFLTVGAIQELDIRTVDFGIDNPLAIAKHGQDGDGSSKESAGHFATITWRFDALGNETRVNDAGGKIWLLSREELNGESKEQAHQIFSAFSHLTCCVTSFLPLSSSSSFATATQEPSAELHRERTLTG